MRKFDGNKLVVATHNKGKLAEIAAVLAPSGVELVGAAALGLQEPEETGATCRDNAVLKARAAVAASGLPAWLEAQGLPRVDTVTTMVHGGPLERGSEFGGWALVSQALG